MITFKHYILLSESTVNIQQLRQKLVQLEYDTAARNHWDTQRYNKGVQRYNKAFNYIKQQIANISPIAEKKFIQFNEFEYMLHQLNKYNYGENHEYVRKYVINELKEVIEWLRQFMLMVIELRLAHEQAIDDIPLNPKKIAKRIASERGRWSTRQVDKSTVDDMDWGGICNAYLDLLETKPLEDTIIDITLALNVSHDEGKLFGATQEEYDKRGGVFYYAPFTIQQFENINNINHKLVEYKLRKMF